MMNRRVSLSVLMEADHWIMFFDGQQEHIIEKDSIRNLWEIDTQPGQKVSVVLPDYLAEARGMV
jgi:hypothetical protein